MDLGLDDVIDATEPFRGEKEGPRCTRNCREIDHPGPSSLIVASKSVTQLREEREVDLWAARAPDIWVPEEAIVWCGSSNHFCATGRPIAQLSTTNKMSGN